MEERDVVHFWVVVHEQLLGEDVPRNVSVQVGVPAVRVLVTMALMAMAKVFMYNMAFECLGLRIVIIMMVYSTIL